METKYCLKVTKETQIIAKTYGEACQIAEIMLAREINDTLFGNLVTVSSEVYELIN
jgi:hypothetical protein